MANLFRATKKGGIIIDHLTITTMPTKTTYSQFDTLDLTGLVVTATYADGITAVVTSAIETTPAAGDVLETAGTNTVIVSYGGATVGISIAVTAMTAISVTTMPTKTDYRPDDQLDLTGIVVTGTAGALSPDITSGCTFSPADGTVLTTEGTIAVTVTYHGLTTSFNATCSSIPAWDSRGLEYNTWDTIKAYADAGILSTVANVGDTKSFTYSGQTLYAKLVGIGNNSDTLHTNYYPLGTADFITVDCLNTTYQMNSSTSYFSNNGGWKDQPLRTTLNSTIYNTLPSDLKAVIIDKVHTHDCGQYSPQNESAGSWSWQKSYESLSDKLWLPTLVEVGLSAYDGSDQDSTYNATYSVFTDNNSRIKKVNGSANNWWLSSPYARSSTTDVNYSRNFANVGSGGSRISYDGVNYSYGVPLCFRI